MKKIFFVLAVSGLAVFNSYGQCVPDTSITHGDPGVYPDSATNLPHAIVGIPYSTEIQLRVLDTTTVIIFGSPYNVTIDHIDIINVNLPVGYTYSSTPATGVFPGNSDGCLLLQGPAPTPPEVGQVYPIIVDLRAYGHLTGIGTQLPPQDTTISYYRIVVDDNVGIAGLSPGRFEVQQNKPNPFHGVSTVEFTSPVSGTFTLKVSNMLGETVSTKMLMAHRGINRIMFNSKDFEPGIYFYTLSNEKNSVTKRMIVDND